jgi:hypothetical protein
MEGPAEDKHFLLPSYSTVYAHILQTCFRYRKKKSRIIRYRYHANERNWTALQDIATLRVCLHLNIIRNSTKGKFWNYRSTDTKSTD